MCCKVFSSSRVFPWPVPTRFHLSPLPSVITSVSTKCPLSRGGRITLGPMSLGLSPAGTGWEKLGWPQRLAGFQSWQPRWAGAELPLSGAPVRYTDGIKDTRTAGFLLNTGKNFLKHLSPLLYPGSTLDIS